ncbi:MAG: hypothetical protein Q8N56_00715 [bacterium]|nr:hypothetical protein [bacterium]
MRMCARCNHPEDNHGKMLDRGYCTGGSQEGQMSCFCLGFVEPVLRPSIEQEIRQMVKDRHEIISGDLQQALKEKGIQYDEDEVARILYLLFYEEKILIKQVPF